MTKTFMMLGATLSMGFAYGQEYNRVGINTEVPQATLDVRETPLGLLPAGTPQGVSFPNFSSDERTKFTGVSEGTMIYNTDLDCIEQYTLREKISPNLDWYCMCLCGDETAVVEKDDEVIINLYGIEIVKSVDSGPFTFKTGRMVGRQYWSPTLYPGNIVESQGNEMVSIGVNQDGQWVSGISGRIATGVYYEAEESGRYTEKRMPYTGWFNVNGGDEPKLVTFEVVIPAGRVEKGSGFIPAYLEFPDNIATLHPARPDSSDSIAVKVSGIISGKSFTIQYTWEEEE